MREKRFISLSAIQENWIASLMIVFSVAVALLDFSGLLDGIPVIKDRVPIFILLLLSTLTGYVAFRRPEEQASMHTELLIRTAQINETIETIDSLKEIRVRSFKGFDDCLEYVNRSIKQAKSKVDSVFWDGGLNFRQVIGQNIRHRELLIIDETNREFYGQHLRNRVSKSQRTYSCAYFRTTKDTALQFVIIDSSEIVFLSNFASHNVSIKHQRIVELFNYHYDEMWQKASKLKQNDRLHTDRINIAVAKPKDPIPADLERCVQSCLEKHKTLKTNFPITR